MDYLKDATKNISLYDVKAYVRKAQNGMFFEEETAECEGCTSTMVPMPFPAREESTNFQSP